ncbi:MAG: siderophore-interacting protein [Sulfitobacter sp.]
MAVESAVKTAAQGAETGWLATRDSAALLGQIAASCEMLELAMEPVAAQGFRVTTGMGWVDFTPDRGGLCVAITAQNDANRFMLRETVMYQLDQAGPSLAENLRWENAPSVGAFPPNFRLGEVVDVQPLGAHFWRLSLRGADLRGFAKDGLHLRLALPARGAAAQWPRLNDKGRVVWPAAQDLHVAVYSIRAIDAASGRAEIDIFRHAGGRSADWVAQARAGEQVGLIGPGGGWIPDAPHLVIAGDETALPAVARILENIAPETTGTALIEVAERCDVPLPQPPRGMHLQILSRRKGESLERALAGVDLGQPGARHVWFAAEKTRASAMRHELRGLRSVARGECYVTAYWQKS